MKKENLHHKATEVSKEFWKTVKQLRKIWNIPNSKFEPQSGRQLKVTPKCCTNVFTTSVLTTQTHTRLTLHMHNKNQDFNWDAVYWFPFENTFKTFRENRDQESKPLGTVPIQYTLQSTYTYHTVTTDRKTTLTQCWWTLEHTETTVHHPQHIPSKLYLYIRHSHGLCLTWIRYLQKDRKTHVSLITLNYHTASIKTLWTPSVSA